MTTRPPLQARLLGYGGLLPFVGLVAACQLDPGRAGAWQQMLLNYGAVILSFVGALHWGLAMADNALSPRERTTCYLWSVMPALLGWLALLLDPVSASCLLATGFAVQLLRDWRVAIPAGLPAWFLPLRIQLSCIAVLSLLLATCVGRI
ncbi:MAG: DUF3429 domain-containing protein [Sphingomonadaceae bacterium]